MSSHVSVLERWETELLAVQAQADGRDADLSELLVKTGEHWKAWAGRWQGLLQLLEERQAVLAAKDHDAAEMVAAAESSLAETEAALREWLAAAQTVARKLVER
jgi:hypothetical protein